MRGVPNILPFFYVKYVVNLLETPHVIYGTHSRNVNYNCIPSQWTGVPNKVVSGCSLFAPGVSFIFSVSMFLEGEQVLFLFTPPPLWTPQQQYVVQKPLYGRRYWFFSSLELIKKH